jgi:hypothetical protein
MNATDLLMTQTEIRILVYVKNHSSIPLILAPKILLAFGAPILNVGLVTKILQLALVVLEIIEQALIVHVPLKDSKIFSS